MRLFRRATAAVFAALLAAPGAKAEDNLRTSAQPIALGTLNAAFTGDLFRNEAVMGVNVVGLTATGATLTIEGSSDAKADNDATKIWTAVPGMSFACPIPATFTTLTSDQSFKVDVSGLTNIRVRVSTAGTGSAAIGLNAIPGAAIGPCVPVSVSAASLPLPSGAASAANQTAVQSAPGSSAATAATVQGSASGVPVPVSAASLPLPSGAASAANQPTLAGDGGAPAHVTNWPASQTMSATNSAGATAVVQPDKQANASPSTIATTQVVAASAGKAIYVTGYDFNVLASATAAAGFSLEYGTGASCGTGTTAITPTKSYPVGGGLSRGGGLGVVLTIPASNALCIVTTAAQPVAIDVSYAQF